MREDSNNSLRYNMVDKYELINEMTGYLKQIGYKKRGQNWRKDKKSIAIAFTIQNSQYDHNTFYLCFGVNVQSVDETKSFNAASFHIQDRIDRSKVNIDQAKYAVELWEEKYGTLEKLRVAAIENRLPLFSDRRAISYLTSISEPSILFCKKAE